MKPNNGYRLRLLFFDTFCLREVLIHFVAGRYHLLKIGHRLDSQDSCCVPEESQAIGNVVSLKPDWIRIDYH